MRRRKNNLLSIRNLLLLVVLATIILGLGFVWQKIFSPDSDDVKIEKVFNVSVKIAILNGNGYPNVATEVKEYFLDNYSDYIDVVGCRNVESNKFIYKQTLVVLKHSEPEKLEYIMKLTNVPHRILAYDDNAIEEVQIILGKDYLEYFPKNIQGVK